MRNIFYKILSLTGKFHYPLILIFLMLYTGEAAFGLDRTELRVKAGLDLFPSLLAADLDIQNKTGPDGNLLLLLIYKDDRKSAEEMARQLSRIKTIRGYTIKVEATGLISLEKNMIHPPAGIFVTQFLGDEISAAIEYAETHKAILFSPFEGDVEKGVLGGIYISDRLLPFINLKALQSGSIRIKQFFIRVSIPYDQ